MIHVDLTPAEARALLPQKGRDLTLEQWNARMLAAASAQQKIHKALKVEGADTAINPGQQDALV